MSDKKPRPWSTLLHPTRSLRARLGLVFGGLSMTLAVLLALALGSRARQIAERTAAESLSTAAAHTTYLLGHWLMERYDDIHILAQLPRIRQPQQNGQVARVFDAYRQDYPGYAWVGLVTREGHVVAGSGPDPGITGVPVPTTRPYIGPVRSLAPDKSGAARRVVDLVVPVTDSDGRAWGAVWAILDWEWAEGVRASLEETLPPGQQENIVVAEPDGTVLLGPPTLPARLPQSIVEANEPGVAEVKTWPDGKKYLTAVVAGVPQPSKPEYPYELETWPDGKQYLTAVDPGKRQGHRSTFPYVVIARQPTEVAFARPRQLERTMVAGGVGVGLVFAVVGWLLASRVTRPLTAIASAAERMRAGDPDVRIPQVPTQDELGGLSESLRNLIAELRGAQAQVAAARDDAESASRAKDRFLAILSHELRTPLTPIMIALAEMEMDGLPTDVRHDLEMVRRNVDLEARLIDDLLDTTRIASGKLRLERQPTDVHAVLGYAIDTCTPDAVAKGIRLEAHAEAKEHTASADPARLEQIFWNLIKNAIKFTPEGGTITVRTRNDESEEAASFGRQSSIVVDVTDTGIGIPPGAVENIFRPFDQGSSRITRQFGGLGLGLAISKSLAESHGGTLTATSPGPHKGSTFTLTLPVVAMPVPAVAAGERPDGSGGGGHRELHILLVEDHADTARMMARILRARGHTVTTAGSVSDALAAASGSVFDVVISDLGLPDGSGTDVMRRLRSMQERPPRGIAVSGYGTEADKMMTREAGFDAHLTKPIKLSDLEPLLERVAQ